jgi:NAD(P)H dehydrogenase (quinone)
MVQTASPTPTPVHIAIVFHSGYGHTQALAEAVGKGAAAFPGAEVALISTAAPLTEAQWATLDGADAIIFGSPTYMGSISASFKGFAEASSSRFFTQAWSGKVAAGFTNSAGQSGDKFNTLVGLATLAAQHGMHWVNLGIIGGNNSTKGSIEDLNRLSSYLGAMSQAPADLGADGIPESDLKTGAALGRRVADVAAQLKRGRAS